MLYPYHERLVGNKKEWTIDPLYNTDKSQNHSNWRQGVEAHKEAFGGDQYAHYVDYGDDFTYIYKTYWAIYIKYVQFIIYSSLSKTLL